MIEYTRHPETLTAEEKELESLVGICPACHSLSEFAYLGKENSENRDESSSYRCTVCSSTVSEGSIKK